MSTLKIKFTNKFKKDYKRLKKQNKDIKKLESVIYSLRQQKKHCLHSCTITCCLENIKVIENATSSPIGF